ncbi:MAG TPA: hypothetical protein VF169_06090 [Albitalea sp.]|uniref:hypothetical protein n=1 Tax=Piscinibacter sp. TaxID=1903157 RepID=UPI002ED38840
MRRAAVLALSLSALAAFAAEPTPAHSADCVAALKLRAEPLAVRVRRGDAAAEAQLVPIATASFAFIGTVYKQGLRQPQADEMLRNAEKGLGKLTPAELVKLQDACQAEGDQLMKQANFIERLIVQRAVRNRIERLKPKPAA